MARYVGKRIVPKHCGYWDNTKAYEMENIVYDRTSGNSYISRKAVPAGTDISQEDYWALCSDFNMQMDLLEKHFTATEQRIAADNDATETAIRQDNDETERAILADNQATREYVDGRLEETTTDLTQTVTEAQTAMTQQKASFDATAQQLNARMDEVLAAGTGDGATEVADARVDAEGHAYDSLGSHIRKATEKIRTIIAKNESALAEVLPIHTTFSWENGTIPNNVNNYSVNTGIGLYVKGWKKIHIIPDERMLSEGYYFVYGWRVYAQDGTTILKRSDNLTADENEITVPENAYYFRFSLARYNGSKYDGLRVETMAGTKFTVCDEDFYSNLMAEYDSIHELQSKVALNTNSLKVSVGKNLIGTEAGRYYPVHLPSGTTITWAFADGSELPSGTKSIYFYDAHKTQLAWYSYQSYSGYTSPTVTLNTSADVEFIRFTSLSESPLQVEIGDTATEYEPYFENAKGLNEYIPNDVYKNVLSLTAGSAHSSLNDRIPVNIKSGEKMYVLVKEPVETERLFQIFSYAQDLTGVAVTGFHLPRNMFTITLPQDTSYIGVFAGVGDTEDSIITFYFIRESSFLGEMMRQLQQFSDLQAKLAFDMSVFTVNAGSVHSSVYDQVKLSVSAGEPFYVKTDGLPNNRSAQIWAYDSSGKGTSVGSLDDQRYKFAKFIAPYDMVAVGMSTGTYLKASTITLMAFASGSVFEKLEDNGYDYEFSNKLINAHRKANTGNYNSMSAPDVFALAHFTDIHGNAGAMARVQRFKDKFSDYLDDTICTGDMVTDKLSDGMKFWNDNSDGSILTCIGNHDSLGANGWGNPVDQATLYETYIAPYMANWSAETVTDKAYYYKDYDEKKIRLVVVDGTIFDPEEQTAQITWLSNALSAAKTNGYSVIGAVHFPPMPSSFHKIECNFSNVTHGTGGDMGQFAWKTYYNSILGAVQDFIQDGGDFVCWLCGHTHNNIVSYDTGYPGQLFITNTCAMPSSIFDECDRDYNENRDAINVVCVDIARKYVKVLRYGANWDDCLRHIGSVVINYGTSPATVVHQV